MLITLKAIDTFKRCDVICVPQSSQGKNLALDIASEYLQGKEILFCKMPMTRDKEVLAYLVLKRGGACSMQDLAAILYEDEPYSVQQRDRTGQRR